MSSIDFFAAGEPETKGSARAFVVGRRAVITNDNPRAKAWAKIVALAARERMGEQPLLDGPLRVEVAFLLARPKAHFGAKGLKPHAPRYCHTRPDVDKLARCLLDALTGIVIHDDARVVRLVVTKRYADAEAGALVSVAPMVDA